MKNIFVLYFYISYSFLKCFLSQIIIPFERNFLYKNETFNFKNLIYNDLVINISIGSEKQNIPSSLRFFDKNNTEKLLYLNKESNTLNNSKILSFTF